jgi:hypothetical protein
MSEEGQSAGVACDPSVVLDEERAALTNRVTQLTGTVVAVHRHAEGVAGGKVTGGARTRDTTFNLAPEGWPLQAGEEVADLKAQAGVERQGAVVVRGLEQPGAGEPSLGRTAQGLGHEVPPDPLVLVGWIDGERSDPEDSCPLVHEDAGHQPAFDLCHDR